MLDMSQLFIVTEYTNPRPISYKPKTTIQIKPLKCRLYQPLDKLRGSELSNRNSKRGVQQVKSLRWHLDVGKVNLAYVETPRKNQKMEKGPLGMITSPRCPCAGRRDAVMNPLFGPTFFVQFRSN